MKIQKLIISFAFIFSLATMTAFASEPEIMLISSNPDTEVVKEAQSHFGSFTGEVKLISKQLDGRLMFSVVNKETSQEANIVTTAKTYFDNSEVSVGDTITGHYKAMDAMIMIYPPQYRAEVVTKVSKDVSVKVDLFDKDHLSADKNLVLNISADTNIVLQDGTKFNGDIANRNLVVFYKFTTRSLPPQTSPDKIVVLFDESNTSKQVDIIVEENTLAGSTIYTKEDGTVLVPLRKIAEALGYTVTWDNESQSIRLGAGVTLMVGSQTYHVGKMAPIYLNQSPELIHEQTFVPLSFFRDVLNLSNAYFFEGQVVINNKEKIN